MSGDDQATLLRRIGGVFVLSILIRLPVSGRPVSVPLFAAVLTVMLVILARSGTGPCGAPILRVPLAALGAVLILSAAAWLPGSGDAVGLLIVLSLVVQVLGVAGYADASARWSSTNAWPTDALFDRVRRPLLIAAAFMLLYMVAVPLAGTPVTEVTDQTFTTDAIGGRRPPTWMVLVVLVPSFAFWIQAMGRLATAHKALRAQLAEGAAA